MTSLAPLKQVLIERTEGNPFFLEESVRTLVESQVLAGGAGGLSRDEGARDHAGARHGPGGPGAWIDRLLPEDKLLLQAAAVIGKDVPFALLQAIAELSEEALRGGLPTSRPRSSSTRPAFFRA